MTFWALVWDLLLIRLALAGVGLLVLVGWALWELSRLHDDD